MPSPPNEKRTEDSNPQKSSKKLIRGSSFMLLGRVIAILVNLAVQVIIVRCLAKSDYGAFAYGLSIASMGSSIAVFGLGKTFNRFVPIFHEEGKLKEMAGTIVLTFATVLTLGTAIVLGIIGLQSIWVQRFATNPFSVSMLVILIFLAPIQAIENLLEKMFAIFADPKALFVRRYVVGPGLKLAAALPLLFLHKNARWLAYTYVAAGLLGVVYSVVLIFKIMKRKQLMQHFRLSEIKVPARKIYGFSMPLVITDLLPAVRSAFVPILLEFFHGTLAVAAFRSVLPIARLNQTANESFKLLFTPTVSRLYARDDRAGIELAFWKNSAWIAVITFPLFAVCSLFAEQICVLVLGDSYASSASVLSILAVGFYALAVGGLATHVMRAFGLVKLIFLIDASCVCLALFLSAAFIPNHGAVGGATAVAISVLAGTCLNIFTLFRQRIVTKTPPAFVGLVAIAAGLLAASFGMSRIIPESLWWRPLLLVISLFLVFWSSIRFLDINGTFPEVERLLAKRGLKWAAKK